MLKGVFFTREGQVLELREVKIVDKLVKETKARRGMKESSFWELKGCKGVKDR